MYPCDVISSAVKLMTDSYQFLFAHLKPASNFSIEYTVCKKSAKNSDAFSKSSRISFNLTQTFSVDTG